MSLREHSPSFYVLDAAERAQQLLYAVAGPHLGAKAIAFATGSKSEAYEQLVFVPRKTIRHASLPSVVIAPPASDNGLPARNWDNAVIIAADKEEIDFLKHRYGEVKEAVSYVSEGAKRVGTRAVEGALFAEIDENHVGLAMRQGNDETDFSIGVWSVSDYSYYGAGHLRTVAANVPTVALPETYPCLRLG
jgi:hypothetical protein